MAFVRRFSTARSIVLGLAARKVRGKVSKGITGARLVTRSTVDHDAPAVDRAEARRERRERARRLARDRTGRREAYRSARTMHRTATRRPLTDREAFTAADWLARFIAADGWYMIHSDKITTGWRVDGKEEEAREIWREIEGDADRREAVRVEMRRRAERCALSAAEF